jgi:hypothetical protein
MIKEVHKHFGIDASLRTRRRDVVDARNAIMVSLRSIHTMNEIARFFPYKVRKDGEVFYKGMSHCSVIHAVKQHQIRYHYDPAERKASFYLYCEIYDFCKNYLGDNTYKPMSQLEMREEIAKARFDVKEKSKQMATLQREYKDEVKELKREMRMLETALRKVTSERDHYKTAFTQMYKEKKARDEKAI